ncbi:hypothetical protein LSTR_LSTR006858 [Laodelphax striatellus]|uniref:Uncharacterized protein n=1 Tax=Laodelphax striatellus TaxID=195883 RepID=A0A482XG89_LAOST|nr:hypothetical protein LSTR_LSTR006858 [Laodelphax striatellus]
MSQKLKGRGRSKENAEHGVKIQFVLVMVHAFQLLFIDCDYPKAFVWWIGLHAIMFYFLFADFYKQTYKKPKVQKSKRCQRRRYIVRSGWGRIEIENIEEVVEEEGEEEEE